jgi:hypothetical protein
MSLLQKSLSDENQKDNYVKDLNSTLVSRIIQIRKEIIDLLAILDDMEERVSKNHVFRESKP